MTESEKLAASAFTVVIRKLEARVAVLERQLSEPGCCDALRSFRDWDARR